MPTRRQFIQTTATASAAYGLSLSAQSDQSDQSNISANAPKSTTFIIVADTHYSSVDEDHPASHAMVNAINRITDGKTKWPSVIEGKATHFSCADSPIATPKGIIHLGDMTDFGSQSELNGGRGLFGLKTYLGFRQFWEHDGLGGPSKSGKKKIKVKYPVYCGLGNHDLDFSQANRERMWKYVQQRHAGKTPPVPVRDFDTNSLSYALQWGSLRILQLHRFPTDTAYGKKPALPWLKHQLDAAKKTNQHVLLCQHYGFDPFSLQSRWWTDNDRKQLIDTITPLPQHHRPLPRTQPCHGPLSKRKTPHLPMQQHGMGNRQGKQRWPWLICPSAHHQNSLQPRARQLHICRGIIHLQTTAFHIDQTSHTLMKSIPGLYPTYMECGQLASALRVSEACLAWCGA